MKKNSFLVAILSLILSCGSASAADLKVGFIYVSPIGEAGWTYQHDLGRRAVEQKFGDRVDVSFVEAVPEGADAERVMDSLAKKGTDLVFATSFGYMEPMLKVAGKHKSKTFEHATGYKTADNMGNYSPRFYEGRYLSGIVAGAMTKTNVIGYVAAFPIPEVVRGINSFMLGAQSVNPDATIRVIWINSWYDPGKEREAADTLLSQGADVVTHHTDSPAAVQAAQESGKMAIGYHSDMSAFGKDAQLAAVVHNWENFYTTRVQEVIDGTWSSRSVWLGIKDGMVDIVALHSSLPNSLKDRVKKVRSQIADGSFHPFTGPVIRQDGSVAAAEGSVMSDGDLHQMNYYVKGVQGELPQ